MWSKFYNIYLFLDSVRPQRLQPEWQGERVRVSASIHRWVLSPWVSFLLSHCLHDLIDLGEIGTLATKRSSQSSNLILQLSTNSWKWIWSALLSIFSFFFNILGAWSCFLYRKLSLEAASMLKKTSTMKIDMNAVEEAAKRAIAEREGAASSDLDWFFMFFIIVVICICGFVFLSIYYHFWLFCMSS